MSVDQEWGQVFKPQPAAFTSFDQPKRGVRVVLDPGSRSLFKRTEGPVRTQEWDRSWVTRLNRKGHRARESRESCRPVPTRIRSLDYGYDTAGRLATVTRDGALTATYEFDANSNRLGGTYDSQDRLVSANGTTYS